MTRDSLSYPTFDHRKSRLAKGGDSNHCLPFAGNYQARMRRFWLPEPRSDDFVGGWRALTPYCCLFNGRAPLFGDPRLTRGDPVGFFLPSTPVPSPPTPRLGPRPRFCSLLRLIVAASPFFFSRPFLAYPLAYPLRAPSLFGIASSLS